MSLNLLSQRAGALPAPSDRSKVLLGGDDMPIPSSMHHNTSNTSASNKNANAASSSVPWDRLNFKLITMSSSSSSSSDTDTIMGDIMPSMTEEGTSDTLTETENDVYTPPDSPEDEVQGKKDCLQHQQMRPRLSKTYSSFRSVSLASVAVEEEEKAYEGGVECDGYQGSANVKKPQGSPPDSSSSPSSKNGSTPKRPVSLARLRTSSLVLPKRYPQQQSQQENTRSPGVFKRASIPPRLDLRGTSFSIPSVTNTTTTTARKRTGLGLGLPSPINAPVIHGGQSSPEEEEHSPRTHNISPRFRSATAPAPVFRVPPTPVLRPMPFGGVVSPISPLDLGGEGFGFGFSGHGYTRSLGDCDEGDCSVVGGGRGDAVASCRRVVSLSLSQAAADAAPSPSPAPSNESSGMTTTIHPYPYQSTETLIGILPSTPSASNSNSNPNPNFTSQIPVPVEAPNAPERIHIHPNGPPPPIPPRRRPIASVSSLIARRTLTITPHIPAPPPLSTTTTPRNGRNRLIEHPHFGSGSETHNLRAGRTETVSGEGNAIWIGFDVPQISIAAASPS